MRFNRLTLLITGGFLSAGLVLFAEGWPQWGQNPQHSGSIATLGQNPNRKLASVIYDPFVAKEQAENKGELLAHYTAVQNRQKSSDPCCKRGLCVPETGILKSRSAATS